MLFCDISNVNHFCKYSKIIVRLICERKPSREEDREGDDYDIRILIYRHLRGAEKCAKRTLTVEANKILKGNKILQ